MEPKLSRLTKLRTKIIETISSWLRVPTKIDRYQFFEVKKNYIELYVEDCVQIGEKVFEMSADEILDMRQHLLGFHMEHIDEPYNLHDSPYYRTCHWHGIVHGNDLKIIEYNEKLQRAIDGGMKLNYF